MNKIATKLIAGLLVLSFGLLCIPESIRTAFADEIQTARANTTVAEEKLEVLPFEFAKDSLKNEEVYILSENHDMRNRYRKVYNLSDGTVLAEQYSTPIHYLDIATSEYEEIDNTLVAAIDEAGTYYKNGANAFDVKIHKNAAQDSSFMEISKAGYKMTFEPAVLNKLSGEAILDDNVEVVSNVLQNMTCTSFESAKISKIEGISSGLKTEFDYSTKKVTEPQFSPSVISEVIYNNFWNEASLQYSLNSSKIEKVITISKSAEQYSYIIKMNTDELSLVKQDDGSILVYTPDNKQLFSFDIPLLVDAQGKTSSAVKYEIIDSASDCYLILSADSEWINNSNTVLPVKIRANINCDTEEENKNIITKTEEGAVLQMNDIALPSYYFLTSASLKYSYQSTFANSSFEVCKVADIVRKSTDQVVQIKKDTLVPIEENIVNEANKVYTQVKKLDISKITDDNISFGFIPASANNGITVYADGANASVLSLQYDLNVGLNPEAVTEQFESRGIVNHVNVYTRNLTSIIDCMNVNSNIMPIQLQMVYNPTYDSYKSDLLAKNSFALDVSGLGKNFKLNLEQYCFTYEIDKNREGYIYIDGSGAVHDFEKEVRSDGFHKHFVCKDCNLTCCKVDVNRVTIYKNEVPYMYFINGRLKWIATPEKTIRVNYEYVNGVERIKKVYNCLEGGTQQYPSDKEAQSVTFAYNSNNLLSSMTSNYGETVSFSYDSSNRLTKISHGSLTLASLGYDSSGRLNKVVDRQKLGYQFDYSSGNSVSSVYGVNIDSTTTGSISNATFVSSGTTKKVNISMSNQETITHQYGFNSSGRCESSYSGYLNKQTEAAPRNSVAIFSKTEDNNYVRTNTAYSYTEDFSQISNGSFDSITGNSPTGWAVNTTNTGNNYFTRSGGYALKLTANSFASRSYNFQNHNKTKYVLSFFAEAWGHDCTLRVTISGKGKSETFNVSYYGQYYAIEVFDPTDASNSGTIKFENLCSTHQLQIDNVTLSPINEYAQSEYKCKEASQTNTQITQDYQYKSEIGNDSRVIKETYIDHYTDDGSNNATCIMKEYSYNDADTGNKSQSIICTTEYIDNGVKKSNTEQVDIAYSDTISIVESTYTVSNEKVLKTYAETEKNIYGYPIKEIGINGERIYYFYDVVQNNYRLVKKIICNNSSTVAAGESHDSHSKDYVETYTYNSYGECSSISDGTNTNSVTDYHNGGSALYSGSGQSWKTDVNVYGNPTAIYENGNSVKQIQYTYGSNQNLSRATYNRSSSNQSYVDYTYDSYGNPISEKWYDKNGSSATAANTATYSYTYDYMNYKQTVISDGMSYAYQANLSGSPLNNKITVSGNNYNANYTYTSRSDGYLLSSVYAFDNFTNGLTRTYSPQYNNKKQIVSEKDGSDFKSEYTYDTMGRMASHKVYNGSNLIITNGYSYDTNKTSGLKYTVNRITRLSGSVGYGYDYLGRITMLSWNRTSEDTITYDKYNRLSSIKSNQSMGDWFAYFYDSNNNLTEIRKRLPNTPPFPSTYITFSYNSKNQLTSYTKAGTTKYYSYDNLGNPVKYGVSSTSAADNMKWTQGTKLASGTYNGNNFSYKYDANGLRYEKTVNGITTRQYLEGNKVIAEEELNTSGTVAHTKYYIYDQTGIAGMVYDGSTYYFEKNLFGDVITIYNASGSSVASYKYDLWGNLTSGGSSGVGKANPFRYRGYYYDDETGFYYLQSRYYDPEICRFISADNLELVPELSGTAGQLNLYAYCNNNPVMYSDPTGEIAITTAILIGMGIGAAIGLGVGLGLGLSNGARGLELAGYIVGGIASGIIAGGIIAASIFTGGTAISAGLELFNSGLGALALAGGGTVGGSMVLVGAGAMAAGGVIVVGGTAVGVQVGNIVFSKHNPGMSNKPPVSWTNIDEGVSVFSASGNNSEKAAEFLLNNKYGAGNWKKGAKTEFNALKKWFDRIIRIRK